MVVTIALPPWDSCRSSCSRCMAVVLSRPCMQVVYEPTIYALGIYNLHLMLQ